MNHRLRAQTRLGRHVPQLRSADSGDLYERLEARKEEGERRDRAVPGDSLVVRDPSAGTTKYMRPADVSQNAPLLMRLVRHPYAMQPVRFDRVEHREPPQDRIRFEPLGPALAYRAELRDAYRLITPTVEFAHRPEDRPAPFATARRARREAEHDSSLVVVGLPVPDDALRIPGPWSGAPVARAEGGAK